VAGPAFGYAVVGGGTAGAVVAARLSEDPRVSVGLVEAGPSDRDEPRGTRPAAAGRRRGRARVADASAFPSLTTVNPTGAVLMPAERAAGLIRPRSGPPPDPCRYICYILTHLGVGCNVSHTRQEGRQMTTFEWNGG